MKVFSFRTEKGVSQIGVVLDGQKANFSEAWKFYKQVKNRGQGPNLDFLQVMLEADFFNLETFEEVIDTFRERRPLDHLFISEKVHLQPPIGRPQKILCVGRNYATHAKELGNAIPDELLFFAKAPSSLLAHERNIQIPEGRGRIDFEGELAVVISKRASKVPEPKAREYVAGYTLLNDVTARELQRADIKKGRPWYRAKSFDSFCPVGPFLVPSEAIPDLTKLEIQTRLNGEVKQKASLAEMIFGISEIVSHISGFCTLEAGDIIATGTPSGVAELTSGDLIEIEVSEIGVLKNKVVN